MPFLLPNQQCQNTEGNVPKRNKAQNKWKKYWQTDLVKSWDDSHDFTGPQRYHNVTSYCVHRINALHFTAASSSSQSVTQLSPIITPNVMQPNWSMENDQPDYG